jgi:hypothetical protein
MIIVALIIGAILIVAAIRDSQGALFDALGQDAPAYVVWAAALFGVAAIGFIPGLRPISRGLVALVIVVIILQNYDAILGGFQALAATSPGASGQTAGSGGLMSGTSAGQSGGAPAPSTATAPGGSAGAPGRDPSLGGDPGALDLGAQAGAWLNSYLTGSGS